MTTTENNVAGDFDPAPKYEYSPDGKTVTWTNRDRMPKVAAQAGDEPMRAAFEAWARDPQRSGKLPLDRWTTNGGYKDSRTYIAFYGWRSALASQVSPRATADVEREKDADRFEFMMRVADNPDGVEAQAVEAIGNEFMETDRPESVQMRELIDAAIATTKPGA